MSNKIQIGDLLKTKYGERWLGLENQKPTYIEENEIITVISIKTNEIQLTTTISVLHNNRIVKFENVGLKMLERYKISHAFKT